MPSGLVEAEGSDCGVECVGVIGVVGIKLLVPVPRG